MPNNQDNPNDLEPAAPSGAGEMKTPDEPPPDTLTSLQQIETLLIQIRGLLDATVRDGEHQDFSPWRLAGSILQVLVAGLVALALLDWLLQAPANSLLIKLAFAAVLQLAALTAFVVSSERT